MKLAAIAFALFATAQDFDKARHPWGKWKVDSFAKYKMTIEAGGGMFEGEYKSVLTELKEKEYSTRHTSSFMGAEQEENEAESFGEKKGEETLKIGEKGVKCVVWATSGKRGEKATTGKVWLSPDSESVYKMSWKAGDDDHGEVTATKLSEKITVGGKEYDTVLLEGEMTVTNVGAMKGKMWMHPSVPGGVVKMTLESDDTKIAIVLAEFDAKK